MDTTTEKLADALRKIRDCMVLVMRRGDAKPVTLGVWIDDIDAALAALKQQPRHEVRHCPHATSSPLRYCDPCPVSPCPMETPAAPRHEGAEDARDAAMTFDEAVNCAWHVAGTTLHSREDIRAAIKAIWPLPVRPRDIAKRCPACDGFGFKRDEGTKDGQD